MAGKTVIEEMDSDSSYSPQVNVALVILNSKQIKTERKTTFSELPGVVEDGEMMKKMLSEYGVVKLAYNVDISQALKNFNKEQKNIGSDIGRMHFHFSGHGVHNARIFIKPEDKLTDSEVDTKTKITETPTGECMVGSSGELYAIHDLKHELLKLGSESITVTLDCCRSLSRTRTGTKSRGQTKDKEVVKLMNRETISPQDQEKMCVLYGSLDGHLINDDQSFTKELFTVTDEGKTNINILHLARNVNDSWERTGQMCKVDIVEVRNNWEDFYWPSNSGPRKEIPAIKENGKEAQSTEKDKKMERMEKTLRENTETMERMNKMIEELQNKRKIERTHDENGNDSKKTKKEVCL